MSRNRILGACLAILQRAENALSRPIWQAIQKKAELETESRRPEVL